MNGPSSPRKAQGLSPKKAVFSKRGARVASATHSGLAPFSTQGRPKVNFSPRKLVAPRGPVSVRNPFVGEPVKLPAPSPAAAPPVLDPPSTSVPDTPTKPDKDAKHQEDEWQDIEEQEPANEAVSAAANETFKADLKPPKDTTVSELQDTTMTASRDPREPDSSSFYGFSPSMRRRSRWSWGSSRTQSQTSFGTSPRKSHAQSTQTPQTPKEWWRDPHTPVLMASYLQLGFNALMVAILLYGILVFYQSVRRDVNMKVEEYSMDIVNEMAQCSQEYLRNNCQPSKRVPALEIPCTKWEQCMNRDPRLVGHARVSAETFGEIVESFLRPIGIKSMIFLVFVFAGSFILVNGVFASHIGPRYLARATETPLKFHSQSAHSQSMSSANTRPSSQEMPSGYMPYSPAHHYPSAHGTPMHTPYMLGYSQRFSPGFSPRFYGASPRQREFVPSSASRLR